MPNRDGSMPINFRASDLEAPLAERAGSPETTGVTLASIAKRDLGRYYYSISMTLKRLTPPLSADEALLLCNALNGVIMEPHTVGLLWANVADAGGADDAFIERLRALSYAEALVIVDAVERVHNAVAAGGAIEEAIRQAGLVR